jgi:hypothetical protein
MKYAVTHTQIVDVPELPELRNHEDVAEWICYHYDIGVRQNIDRSITLSEWNCTDGREMMYLKRLKGVHLVVKVDWGEPSCDPYDCPPDDLPDLVAIPDDIREAYIDEWLENEYGFMVDGFETVSIKGLRAATL